ncbi:uncharacterized protein LOC133825323 [Humulus lupulus]|uniref:uncharacterized protein LOC133825323 n=1 Tax=Humulus lupulus TaxID=3486 RepID=UPI002B4057FD|nr:uncharacterized protein LOC133825323 [Humulus lupulus]
MVVNSFLLTRDNLAKANIQISSFLCPVCDEHLESHQHLFFDCCLSMKVLGFIFTWIGFPAWSSKFSACTVSVSAGNNNRFSLTLNMILAAVVYSIWRNRNRCLFDGYSLSTYCIAKEIITLVKYRMYMVQIRKDGPLFKLFLKKLQLYVI